MPTPPSSAGPETIHLLEGALKAVGDFLGLSTPAPAAANPPSAKNADTPDVPSEIADMKDEIGQIRSSMHDMRLDLTTFGKSLGTIMTVVLGAIGYTQLHSFFPFPHAHAWVKPAVIAALVSGVGGATFLVFRFFFAKRRVLLEASAATSVPGRWSRRLHFWRSDRYIADATELWYAHREGMRSLKEVEDASIACAQQARSLRDQKKTAEADEAWRKSYRFEKVVDLALWDASADVLERRTRGAYGGPVAALAVILTVGGLGFTFAAADWAKSRHDSVKPSGVAAAVKCANSAAKGTPAAARTDLYAACAKLIAP
jgi:uncharacterized membrane protein YeaQ/YmgE (transglycosylase-associated protein family)